MSDFRSPEAQRRLERRWREHDERMARIRARLEISRVRLARLDRNIEAMKRQAGML
jgi:hypothetical protein